MPIRQRGLRLDRFTAYPRTTRATGVHCDNTRKAAMVTKRNHKPAGKAAKAAKAARKPAKPRATKATTARKAAKPTTRAAVKKPRPIAKAAPRAVTKPVAATKPAGPAKSASRPASVKTAA